MLERISNESRARFGKLVDKELYLQIESQGGFEFPPLPEPLVTIDTSMTAVDDAVAQIEVALISVT